MVGWDKGGRGIIQHDDAGSHKDCTRPSNLEKDPEGAAVACLSSIANALSQVSHVRHKHRDRFTDRQTERERERERQRDRQRERGSRHRSSSLMLSVSTLSGSSCLLDRVSDISALASWLLCTLSSSATFWPVNNVTNTSTPNGMIHMPQHACTSATYSHRLDHTQVCNLPRRQQVSLFRAK